MQSTTPPSQAAREDERAENFSEADPLFDDMLQAGLTFVNYLGKWDCGAEPIRLVDLDQQERLGLARSAYRAFARFERDTEKRVRESLAGEANVERVARAIALEFDIDPDVFIGMHGKEKWVNEWHKIARAALSTLERTTDAG